MYIYYMMSRYNARLFGNLFCRIAQFGDMPARLSKLETGTGAGPTGPDSIHCVGATSATCHLPALGRSIDGRAGALDEFDVLDQSQIHHTYGPGRITGHAELAIREPAIGIQHPARVFCDFGLWWYLPGREWIAYLYTDLGTNFG
jgi:hypothetical protein